MYHINIFMIGNVGNKQPSETSQQMLPTLSTCIPYYEKKTHFHMYINCLCKSMQQHCGWAGLSKNKYNKGMCFKVLPKLILDDKRDKYLVFLIHRKRDTAGWWDAKSEHVNSDIFYTILTLRPQNNCYIIVACSCCQGAARWEHLFRSCSTQ